MITERRNYLAALWKKSQDDIEETCQSGNDGTANHGQMEVLLLGSKVPSKNHPKKDKRIKERDKAISYVE